MTTGRRWGACGGFGEQRLGGEARAVVAGGLLVTRRGGWRAALLGMWGFVGAAQD